VKQSLKTLLLVAGLSTGAAGMLANSAGVAAAATITTEQSQQQAFTMPQPPAVMAKSVVLMDADNGQILYEKDADERRAPASTTKLMTMLLTLEAVRQHRVSWTDEVPVTEEAYKVATASGVSNAYLDPKEHFTLDDMMKFIAVLSANDATIAVAEKIGGDKDAFVQMMNRKAQELGLTNTHYMNPDGLPAPNHYTSARDLAKLARYLVTNYPEVLKYTSIPKIQVRAKNSEWPNTDKLLGHYTGVDGLKTGYTEDAGYCYVGTAKQNGVRLICVVMADTKTDEMQRFRDTAKLFDYGFHNFTETVIAKKGQPLNETVDVPNGADTTLAIAPKDDLIVDLPNGVKGTLQVEKVDEISAPVKKGDKVGTLKYVVNNHVIFQTDAVAAEDDGKANWFVQMLRAIGRFISSLFHKL
jgi:D-alanyl-D-alanine carboxypeptidase (penicillin-binding protein 5/6)